MNSLIQYETINLSELWKTLHNDKDLLDIQLRELRKDFKNIPYELTGHVEDIFLNPIFKIFISFATELVYTDKENKHYLIFSFLDEEEYFSPYVFEQNNTSSITAEKLSQIYLSQN